jgi:glycerate 2-kinase
MTDSDRAFLRQLFTAAHSAADPFLVVPPHLPPPPKGRLVVVGCGKASGAMAAAAEAAYDETVRLGGVVVVPYGHAVDCNRVEIVEAAHPVPDESSVDASRRILEVVSSLGEDDLVLALVSGGGSAVMAQPIPGVTLDEKQAVTKALLASGAPISEINLVRTHLSAIKGGGLTAAAYPAPVLSLLISDVPGDDPSTIASGPTSPPRGTVVDALEVLERRGIDLPDHVRRALESGAGRHQIDDQHLGLTRNTVVAAPQLSLEAAAQIAAAHGVEPVILGDAIEGESREVARVLAGIARQIAMRDQPATRPCVLLSGGETTVTLRGGGCGGPNVELLLALALSLQGAPGVSAIACDTDGVDGAAPVAGAVVTPDTLQRAARAGLDARRFLMENDAHSFFDALGDQVITGPTLTNVNDFRAVLVRRA